MSAVKIYHNPHCSKSIEALKLLKSRNINLEIIDYVESAPAPEELRELLRKLGLEIRDIIRTNETKYQELGLDNNTLSDTALINAVCNYPRLLQRPIIIKGTKAWLGRPLKNVLRLLNEIG